MVQAAPEHLLVGLPEVFREKCVYDRIHRGIAVRQAVGQDSEEEGGRRQRENSKLSPEMDDVVWQPGDPKNHDHHQDRLCRLGGAEGESGEGKENSVRTGKERSTLRHVLTHSVYIFMGSNRLHICMKCWPSCRIRVLFKLLWDVPRPATGKSVTCVECVWITGMCFASQKWDHLTFTLSHRTPSSDAGPPEKLPQGRQFPRAFEPCSKQSPQQASLCLFLLLNLWQGKDRRATSASACRPTSPLARISTLPPETPVKQRQGCVYV